ncbi:adenylate cyclase [Bdellovibrio sp. ZAP7]|uniref:adenylate cyclase n=1 Tax=Bdellovibrio sp. ZAP7 TaxID=2231053 RepID=UPI001FF00499|nr:adenylate cyclase [Bdellovibrio sp. ZAP7]
MFAKGKRNKSMVLLIVGTFWVAYVGITATQFYFNVAEMTEQVIETKHAQMTFVEDSQISALVGENTDLVKANLDKARELNLIHFYILQKGSDLVSFHNNNGDAESINADYKVFNEILATKNIAFRTIKIMDYRLTVGVFQNKPRIIMQTAWDYKGMILRDLVSVTVFLSLIVWLFLKDIIDLTKILSSRDREKMTKIRSLSKEGATLLHAAQTYEATQRTLAYENKVYTETLTPAIVHELKSGRKAPYAFQTSMVRVDLNGYTQIFLDKKDEYVSDMMNQYFIRSREIIERYNGLIYQYVGDEIVFHVKECQGVNSQAMSLACLRAIFEVAQDIEDHLPAGADHYFKVKGSFVIGKIRFVPQDSGYGLSGLPLIESARLLSQVDEKAKSSITFYSEASSSVNDLCTIAETKSTMLKGFSTPATLCKVNDFTSIDRLLGRHQLEKLTYYRSDSDLICIYRFLEKSLQEKDEISFFRVFSVLKTFKVNQTSLQQVAGFEKLVETAYKLNKQKDISDKVLASVVSLASNLIPHAFVESSLLAVLEKCLDHKDPRTQANTIIVLGDLARDVSFLRQYIYASHNRVSADALLVTGKQNFDTELAKKLFEFLESKNPLFRASGSFVVKHLADHYKSTDPVFFETNTDLKKLLKKAA